VLARIVFACINRRSIPIITRSGIIAAPLLRHVLASTADIADILRAHVGIVTLTVGIAAAAAQQVLAVIGSRPDDAVVFGTGVVVVAIRFHGAAGRLGGMLTFSTAANVVRTNVGIIAIRVIGAPLTGGIGRTGGCVDPDAHSVAAHIVGRQTRQVQERGDIVGTVELGQLVPLADIFMLVSRRSVPLPSHLLQVRSALPVLDHSIVRIVADKLRCDAAPTTSAAASTTTTAPASAAVISATAPTASAAASTTAAVAASGTITG
jgi:hypothetical protein